MNEQQRRHLVENGNFRLANGEKCRIGGWKNSVYATATSDSPGFYSISWEALKRARENNEPISLGNRVGSAWLGV